MGRKVDMRCAGWMAILFCFAAFLAPAEVRRWSGGGDGAQWSDSANWLPAGVPQQGDQVFVGGGAIVKNASAVFTELTIEKGAVVELRENLSAGNTVTVSGTLGASTSGGVLRLNGATVNLSGHLAASVEFLDTRDGTINFKDGAAFDNPEMPFEHKGTNTFTFTLSENGFTPIRGKSMDSGRVSTEGAYAEWKDVTYRIDARAYDFAKGKRVDLMRFDGCSWLFRKDMGPAKISVDVADPEVDVTLLFEQVPNSQEVCLYLLTTATTWTGAADRDWRNPKNWTDENLPSPKHSVRIPAGAVVDHVQNVFRQLVVEPGATINLAMESYGREESEMVIGGRIDQPVTNVIGSRVLRLLGTVSLSGTLGKVDWLDLRGTTFNLIDGAVIENPQMALQNRFDNTFGFKFSATGFQTVHARSMYTDSGETWSNLTYNVDISDYRGPRPREFVLLDYDYHSEAYGKPFEPEKGAPKVHVTGLRGGTLRFDPTQSQLIFRVNGILGTRLLLQ